MTASAGHVFVSHSSDNRELANELAGFIEGRGVKVWIAPRDVPPGKDYSEQLQLAIESCAAFVVLVTDMANKSPYVRAETEMAFSSHKPIFPIRTSDIKPAPGLAFFLKIRHWTDAFGAGKSQSLERLIQELQAVTAAAAPTPATPAPPPAMAAVAATAPTGATAHRASPPGPPPMPSTAEEEEKWRAAVGPNADYYLKRWREMEAKKSSISWNWPACIVNLFWFAYRKMWGPMVALIVALLVLGVLGAGSPVAGRLAMLISIGLSFVTGGFGNHLYRKQVARLVAEAPSLDRLRERGGVSKQAVTIAVAIFAVLMLLVILGTALALQQKAQLEANQLNANAGMGSYPSQTEQWQEPGSQTESFEDPYGQDPSYVPPEGDKPTE